MAQFDEPLREELGEELMDSLEAISDLVEALFVKVLRLHYETTSQRIAWALLHAGERSTREEVQQAIGAIWDKAAAMVEVDIDQGARELAGGVPEGIAA